MAPHPPVALSILLAVGIISSCEWPQAPEWNVDLLVPFGRQTLGIDSLLPAGVSVRTAEGHPTFFVELLQDSARYSLGQVCARCRPLQGITAPVPGFDLADTLRLAFPRDLISMDVVTAALGVRFTNGLDFDPLRPNADPAAAGWVRVEAIDAGSGAVLDSLLINGADETLPVGMSRDLVLRFRDRTLSGGILVAASIHSPRDGQTTTVDTAATLQVEPVVDTIAVSAVTAEVRGGHLSSDYEIRFERGIRDDVVDRIQEALIELELRHTLEIAGTLDVSLAGSPRDLFADRGRSIRLRPVDFSYAPDGRAITRSLTAEEIQFLAGLPRIYVGLSAVADARTLDGRGRPAVTFLPTDSIVTRLQITTNVEAND